MTFKKWLSVFISEKDIDREMMLEVEHNGDIHFVSVGVLESFICRMDKETLRNIKNTILKIDYVNGDVLHFFKYMAKGMLVATF